MSGGAHENTSCYLNSGLLYTMHRGTKKKIKDFDFWKNMIMVRTLPHLTMNWTMLENWTEQDKSKGIY